MMFQYMCLSLVILSLLGIAAGQHCCPNGWVTYETSCYFFADETLVNWTEGTHFCASHGRSTMVKIDSDGEELFLRSQCKKLFKTGTDRNNWFWIGATDDEIEGIWVWYTDHSLLSKGYQNWYPGQPENNSPSDQDCACLWGQGDYTWHDYHCEMDGHVICEKNSTLEDDQTIIG